MAGALQTFCKIFARPILSSQVQEPSRAHHQEDVSVGYCQRDVGSGFVAGAAPSRAAGAVPCSCWALRAQAGTLRGCSGLRGATAPSDRPPLRVGASGEVFQRRPAENTPSVPSAWQRSILTQGKQGPLPGRTTGPQPAGAGDTAPEPAVPSPRRARSPSGQPSPLSPRSGSALPDAPVLLGAQQDQSGEKPGEKFHLSAGR